MTAENGNDLTYAVKVWRPPPIPDASSCGTDAIWCVHLAVGMGSTNPPGAIAYGGSGKRVGRNVGVAMSRANPRCLWPHLHRSGPKLLRRAGWWDGRRGLLGRSPIRSRIGRVGNWVHHSHDTLPRDKPCRAPQKEPLLSMNQRSGCITPSVPVRIKFVPQFRGQIQKWQNLYRQRKAITMFGSAAVPITTWRG